MKFCQDHWNDLRREVREVGLDAWVPDSGEKAAQMLGEIQAGQPATIDNFDPLMRGMFAITSAASNVCLYNDDKVGALAILVEQICPQCFLNLMCSDWMTSIDDEQLQAHLAETQRGPYDEWSKNAAQYQLTAWKELNG